MADWKDLADLMFPDVDQTIADLEKKYPPRTNAIVLVSRLVLLDFCILVEFFALVSWRFITTTQLNLYIEN